LLHIGGKGQGEKSENLRFQIFFLIIFQYFSYLLETQIVKHRIFFLDIARKSVVGIFRVPVTQNFPQIFRRMTAVEFVLALQMTHNFA
jgi:hypothetical protein